jgi:hypothetical protein
MAKMMSKTEIIESVQVALEKKEFNDEAKKLIQRATKKALQRCQQDFVGAAQESGTAASRKLSQTLKRNLLALASDYYDDVVTFDGAVLPANCRFVRRKEGCVSILIEQPPMVRTILFRTSRHERITFGDTFRLALPYCLFAMNFQDRTSRTFYCGWRDRPMKSLEDKWHGMGFPNMNGDFTHCWGDVGISEALQGKTVAEQCDEYIDKFWQSEFNGDLHDMYDLFVKHNCPNEGVVEWQRKTARDPLWILKARYPGDPQKLRQYVAGVDGTIPDSSEVFTSFNQQDHFLKTVAEQITQTVVQVSNEVGGLIDAVDFQKEIRPKIVNTELSGVIKEIIIQAYAELCEYNDAVLARERVRLEDELATILRSYEKTRHKETW